MERQHDMDIPEDLRRAADFHGHLCPGLAIGYRAVLAAMRKLGAERAEDEELVCVVENDSCSVDAVQYLAGCTFGKGNLFFRDYGKQVFTFASRSDPGHALRVSLKPGTLAPPEGDVSPERRRERALERLLAASEEELFYLDEVDMILPEEASVQPSMPCAACGEATMQSRMVEKDGVLLCRPCSEGWKPPPR